MQPLIRPIHQPLAPARRTTAVLLLALSLVWMFAASVRAEEAGQTDATQVPDLIVAIDTSGSMNPYRSHNQFTTIQMHQKLRKWLCLMFWVTDGTGASEMRRMVPGHMDIEESLGRPPFPLIRKKNSGSVSAAAFKYHMRPRTVKWLSDLRSSEDPHEWLQGTIPPDTPEAGFPGLETDLNLALRGVVDRLFPPGDHSARKISKPVYFAIISDENKSMPDQVIADSGGGRLDGTWLSSASVQGESAESCGLIRQRSGLTKFA